MSELKKRRLGKSDIIVSEIGFGLWAAGGNMWGPTNDQEVLDAILAIGVLSKQHGRGRCCGLSDSCQTVHNP